MGNLEPIEGKTTSWEGLWWHPEYNGYSSAAISLADLKKFKGKVRLYVRKNKYYSGGENGRPNYHFCLRDANSETFQTLEVEEDRSNLQAKINRLKEVLQEAAINGEKMMLPSESAANAKAYMEEAISIVEELTGEKWEFPFLSWG